MAQAMRIHAGARWKANSSRIVINEYDTPEYRHFCPTLNSRRPRGCRMADRAATAVPAS
jgi:hypothetical protein